MLRPSHFHISVLSRVPLAWAATSCTKREFCSIDLLRLLCSLNLLKLTSEIQKHKQRYSLVVFHTRCCDVPKIFRKNHRTIGGSVLAGKGGPRGWLRPSRFPCCVLSYFSLIFVMEHSRRCWLHIGGSKMFDPLFRAGLSFSSHFFCKIFVFDISKLNIRGHFLVGSAD